MASDNSLVFDIQRFSVHDGPGIRTVVFLKGCSLHCFWCQNPESIKRGKELMFIRERCIGCGKCAVACPRGAIDLQSPTRIVRAKCNYCGRCADTCVSGAIKMIGRAYRVHELLAELTRDMPFFDAGGGGVTFSGGEPLLHDTYLTRVLAKCKAEGIHTCIETAGNVRWPAFQHILKYTDLFLYDLKVMNPVKHRKYTGAGNSEILKNAERLCKVANVMFRMPIIPGYNNDRDNIARVASFLRKVEKPTIHLLPYNKLGEIKYPRLGKEFTIHINSTPNAVVVAKHKFRAHGIIAEIISY